MPAPKRMSDILASSSTDPLTTASPLPTAPSSSDGPTLPILGASVSEHSTKVAAPQGQKRKRTAQPTRPAETNVQTNVPTSQASQRPRTNHPSLYEPWTLLPAPQRRALEAQGVGNVVTVVFGRNQNVRAGINRIKRCLREGEGGVPHVLRGEEGEGVAGEGVKGEEGVIAISAQGDGTVKLVGVVDMTRRIVGEQGEEEGGKEGEGVRWWLYTSLSSVDGARGAQDGGREDGAAEMAEGGEGMHVDVDVDVDVGDGGGAVQESQTPNQPGKTKIVPVLTVWMTRTRIPTFKDAFGEQSFTVYDTVS